MLNGTLLAEIARDAGAVIMDIYAGDMDVSLKGDASPVTAADKAAEALITERLRTLAPDLPIIAEEAASDGVIPEHGTRFALVDPLDGTREFISKNGDFTVNIAIIEQGRTVMSVIYAPAKKRLFVQETPRHAWQCSLDVDEVIPSKSEQIPLTIRALPAAGPVAVASRSHRGADTDAFLKEYNVDDIVGAGSSLKFCLIAAGEADIYPRLGRTMEWDTAAGQGIVEAAGGRVVELSGAPLLYGKRERGYDNPHFLVLGNLDFKHVSV